MARIITQNLSQVAADADGFSTNQNYVADDFLVLDGALASTLPWNGDAVVDLSANSVGTLVGFTTGLTGSTANVTIIGRNQFGNPITEVVTMPGASSTVSSVNIFSYIESMQIDGVATNLSVGILGTDDQYGPWIPLDHYQTHPDYNVQVQVVSGTLAASAIEKTLQENFLRNGPEPDLSYDAAAPFASIAATTTGVISGEPMTAIRLRIDATSVSAVVTLRVLPSGGGHR